MASRRLIRLDREYRLRVLPPGLHDIARDLHVDILKILQLLCKESSPIEPHPHGTSEFIKGSQGRQIVRRE